MLDWKDQEPKQLRELEGVPDPKETRKSVQAELGVMREEKRVGWNLGIVCRPVGVGLRRTKRLSSSSY